MLVVIGLELGAMICIFYEFAVATYFISSYSEMSPTSPSQDLCALFSRVV